MYPDYELRKGLENLKTAFLLIMIALALSWIPFISLVSGLLELVGLIFLIMAWRGLGRSGLNEAKYYRSTGNWVIFSIIGGIVIGIVALIVAFLFLFSQLPNLGGGPALSTFPFLPEFLLIFFGILSIALGLSLYSYYRIFRSLKKLSIELEQTRFSSSANFFALGFVVAIVGAAFLFWIIFTGTFLSSFQPSASSPFSISPFGGFLFGGLWPFEVLIIGSAIVEAVGAYYGYSAAKLALGKIGLYSPPYPSPPYLGNLAEVNFCPNCGQKILYPNSSQFCSNCGSPLRP